MKEYDIENKIKTFLECINVKDYNFLKAFVPITHPITDKQHKISKALWPINYQPTYYSNMVYSHKESEKDEIYKLVKEMIDKQYTCLVYNPDNKKIIINQTEKKSCNPISHSIMNLINRYSSELLNGSINTKTHIPNEDLNFTEQYFMENMYIISKNEPCPMCSMALTHSRIKRLYYLTKSDNGAIESKLKLCNYENLNHSFQSFRIEIY
jgi:tRNA-specific adenosine deaminase 3